MNPNGYNIAVTLDTEARKEHALKVLARVPIEDREPYRMHLARKKDDKTREQEKKYHAQIGDIANQVEHYGRKWDSEDMKRLLVNAFKHDTKDELAELWRRMGDVRLVPALNNDGFVALGDQTRRFPKDLASAFIEWLYAFGDEHEVRWSDEAARTI